MTRILLSAPMVKSIKNRDGLASRAWFKRASTLSCNITNRNERGDSKSPHEYYISVQWRKYTTNIACYPTPLRPKNYLTKNNKTVQSPKHQKCLTRKVSNRSEYPYGPRPIDKVQTPRPGQSGT